MRVSPTRKMKLKVGYGSDGDGTSKRSEVPDAQMKKLCLDAGGATGSSAGSDKRTDVLMTGP